MKQGRQDMVSADCSYGLCRLLKSLGHECLVVAPALVPKKAGE
jgi:transposase